MNDPILDQAKAIAAAHNLNVTLNSMADVNMSGITNASDFSVKLLYVVIQGGPKSPNPGLTQGVTFNCQSDAIEYGKGVRAQGDKVLFTLTFHEGRELTRLLYFDGNVVVEGANQIAVSQAD